VLHKIALFIPFSLVAELGLLLRNRSTHELRFFYPGMQTLLFNGPVKIFSPNSIKTLLKRYNEQQLLENLFAMFPESDWVFLRAVCVRCFITIAQFL